MHGSNIWVIMSRLRCFGANFEEFELASHGKCLYQSFRVILGEFKWLSDELNELVSVWWEAPMTWGPFLSDIQSKYCKQFKLGKMI